MPVRTPSPLPLRAFVALLISASLFAGAITAPATAQQSGGDAARATTPKAATTSAAPKATTPKPTTPKPKAPTTGDDAPLQLDDSPQASERGSAGSLVRTIIGLAIVIGVIYGVTWVLKQMRAAQEENATGTGLSSAATLPLGPGRSVHLIQAGQEYLLVGVAEDAVNLLRTYTAEEARASGLLDETTPGDGPSSVKMSSTRPGGGSFVDRLRDLTVRR